MPRWMLAFCFLLCSPVSAQVGKDTGYWEFIKDDPKSHSIVTVACDEGVAAGFVVVIDGDRFLVTAAHIVMKEEPETHRLTEAPAANIFVRFRGGVINKATVKAFDLKNDVCWLEVEIPDEIPALEVSIKPAKPGDRLYVISLGGLTQKAAPIRHWSCVATSATGNEIIADTSLIPGDSGGCVLNESGEVVGVVSGGWTWQMDKAFAEDGRPINVTWPCRACNVGFIRDLLGK